MFKPFVVRFVRPRAPHTSGFRLKGAVLAVALAATCLAATTSFADLHPNVRHGWFLGFAAGGGSAGLTGDGESSDREGGSAGSLRAGYAISPDWGIGGEGNMWFKSQGGVDFTLSTFTASVYYYPGQSGLVLRGGIGGGDAEAEVSQGNTTVTATESGLGISAGVGYDIRLARTFALGPQLDFGYVNVDSFDANYFNLGVSFNWYFIPK